MDKAVVILGAARTPIGAFLGELAFEPAPALGACAIRAAVDRSGVERAEIDACVMGCVLSAGLGQAPARQAARFAGLPDAAGCVTINKMCGSGMKAVMDAHDQIRAESARLVVAGGMESMSRAPYLLEKTRAGMRMGHGRVVDHLLFDGLEDAYAPGRLMGDFVEDLARSAQFTRAAQDDFARLSLSRAQQAQRDGAFDREVAPVSSARGGATIVADELPRKATVESIEKMRPAFRPDGTLTAANSSAISDGAAAVVVASLAYAEAHGIAPVAAIKGHATHADAPARFPVAPIAAVRKLLERVGWGIGFVDLFEINEAFAVVTMAAMRDLGLPPEKVNIHGGACALCHPIGASGARIVVTLLSSLARHGLKRGVATLCIGGGEATAIAVERMN
jgi:acetyl-CoA C-acetyltransferase